MCMETGTQLDVSTACGSTACVDADTSDAFSTTKLATTACVDAGNSDADGNESSTADVHRLWDTCRGTMQGPDSC